MTKLILPFSLFQQVRIQERAANVGQVVAVMSETSHTGCRPLFHSDPNPQPEDNQKDEAELCQTMAEQGFLTTRSLDNSISVGYRRCGHQTRWR